MSARVGPLESAPWPDALEAQAISTTDGTRLYGYDVESDLAAHYRFSDLVFLAIRGELPDEQRSRAFEIALMFSLPVSVGEAPIHAAALARVCGARPGGVASVASLALAETLGSAVRAALPVLRGASESVMPGSSEDAASVNRLRALLRDVLEVPLLSKAPPRELALLAVLWECGLRTEEELVNALVLARLPSAVAESAGRRPLDFASYPTTTPPIDYQSP